jgi:hypothetical protein
MAVLTKPDAIRSAEQNAKLHAMCRDFARQMEWAGRRWSEKDWKAIFLGGLLGQSFVPNPFGHSIVVVNNGRSSRLTVERFAELLGEIEAFGVSHGIEWSENDDP